MILHSLQLTGFRNFERLDLTFSPAVNILQGRNGSGKTNILEAIFVLCLGRSHRTSQRPVLINDDSDHFRISGRILADGSEHELAFAYQRGGRNKVTLESVPIKLVELYRLFAAVVAGPDDTAILAGSPSNRRTFVDIYLSQYNPRYIAWLSDYQQILAQKNAALRQEMDPTPFSDLLIECGAEIITARWGFIEQLDRLAGRQYAEIAAGKQFTMHYAPSFTVPRENGNEETVRDAFAAAIERNAARERIMQTAMVGPHRDDIDFQINACPARTHGSQGELRTAAVSLKLAIYHLLAEKRRVPPILLLDEIFAELDRERAAQLIGAFGSFGQVFVTSAIEPPDIFPGETRRFTIDRGAVVEAS